MSALHPFHLAFPVTSLAKARAFYGGLPGCPEGRSSDAWIDFNLYGHQIVAHLAPEEAGHRRTSEVDGDDVPVRHFGVVLSMMEWDDLAARLRKEGVKFLIEPHVRFINVPAQEMLIEQLGSKNINELVAFKAVVTKRAEVMHRVKIAVYRCEICDSTSRYPVIKNFSADPRGPLTLPDGSTVP